MYNHEKFIAIMACDLINFSGSQDKDFTAFGSLPDDIKVKELSAYPEILNLATASTMSYLSSKWNDYLALFPETDELYLSEFKNKPFSQKTAAQRAFSMCERGEAYYYAYHLIPKLSQLQKNLVRFDRASSSGSSIEPSASEELQKLAESYKQKAEMFLTMVSFDNETGISDNNGGFYVNISEPAEEEDPVYVNNY